MGQKSIFFGKYTFKKYTFRKYTFENYTFEKYTFKKYTFKKYTFRKHTLEKYTFEKYTFEKYTFGKYKSYPDPKLKNNWGPLSSTFHVGQPETLTDWKSESVTDQPTDGQTYMGRC